MSLGEGCGRHLVAVHHHRTKCRRLTHESVGPKAWGPRMLGGKTHSASPPVLTPHPCQDRPQGGAQVLLPGKDGFSPWKGRVSFVGPVPTGRDASPSSFPSSSSPYRVALTLRPPSRVQCGWECSVGWEMRVSLGGREAWGDQLCHLSGPWVFIFKRR